jgi:hypothetical protein
MGLIRQSRGGGDPLIPGSVDARTLLNLPVEERDRLLEQATALVGPHYVSS